MAAMYAAGIRAMSAPVDHAADRAKEIEKDWRTWYAAIFGQDFVDALAPHHEEAIEWHWDARTKLNNGERPNYLSYFAIWSRRHMKSTIARRVAVCDAARSNGGYCLYVGGTEEKVKGHALSIETLLTSKPIKHYYPKLAQVRKNEQGSSKGWRQTFIYTEHGHIFHFVSLDKGVAGANVDDWRPTMIVPDDIDDREDSPAISEHRFKLLTRAVLPTRQDNTLILFAQNLISRLSVMYRIYKGKDRALTNRFPTKPIPAIRGMKTEVKTVDGVVQDVITSGESTWHKYDMRQAQDEVNTVGLPSFEAEYNHEVEQQKVGLILPEWDERVHIITWSQFKAVYGTPQIPRSWPKYVGHDWGNIHPCVVNCITIAPENARRPGLHFLFAGLTAKQNSLEDDVALALIERLAPDIDLSPVRNLDTKTLAQWQSSRVTDVLDIPRQIALKEIKPKVVQWLRRDRYALWHMSHERKTIRERYNLYYGLPFQACNPGADGGITELRQKLRVDYKQPHPFKPGEMGLCGLYFIVDDDQYYHHDADGALESDAKDDKGLKLLREQFPDWQWRNLQLTENGLQDEKPGKVFDDCGNSLMMLYAHPFKPMPLTVDEQLDSQMAEGWRAEDIAAIPNPVDRQRRDDARQEELNRVRQEIANRRRPVTHDSPILDNGNAWDIN